jgi:autotransporter-associated beta strand protein
MTGANWAGGSAPAAGDNLVFPGGPTQTSSTNNFPAGTTFGSIAIAGAGYSLAGNALTLSAGLSDSGGTASVSTPLTLGAAQSLLNTSGAALTVGSINQNGNPLTLESDGSSTIVVSGPISGTGGLVTTGAGTVTLAAANSYTGTTQVNGGTLDIQNAQALGTADGTAATGATVNHATLLLDGAFTVSGKLLTLNGPASYNRSTLEGSGNAEWAGNVNIVGPSYFIVVNGGQTLKLSGTITSSSGVDEQGGGRLILTGNDSSLGIGQLFGPGTLEVDGSIAGVGYLWSGSTLQGSGTLGGSINLAGGSIQAAGTVGNISAYGSSGGMIDPAGATGTGILRTGALTLAQDSVAFELNGNTARAGYDQLQASGSVSLSSVTLQVTLGYTPSIGQQFTLIQNTSGSPVAGTFNGYVEGSLVTVGDVVLQLTYAGGSSGHDIVLTTQGPSTPAPVSATGGYAFSATEGTDSSVQTVASFTDSSPNKLEDYQATVTWGDSHTSVATIANGGIVQSGNSFSVNLSHHYAEDGTFTVTTVVAHEGLNSNTVTSSATVADAALTAGTLTVPGHLDAGQSFSGTVYTFTDGNASNTDTGDFVAQVDPGNGTGVLSSATAGSGVSVVNTAAGVFSVMLTGHTYAMAVSGGTFTVTVTDQAGAAPLIASGTISVNPPVQITTATLPAWTVSAAGYSQTITATGGAGSFVFSNSGTLPPGLSFSSAGLLSGTPNTAGSYSFTVTAADPNGGSGSKNYTLIINPSVTITTTTLPDGTVNLAGYSQTISASGGTGTITFALTDGILPPGLALSTAGVLAGMPTAVGIFTFSVAATDSIGATSPGQSYTVKIHAVTVLTSPGGFFFDPQVDGDGAGQLVQGTNNAFGGLNRLQVDGIDYSSGLASAADGVTAAPANTLSNPISVPAVTTVTVASTTVVVVASKTGLYDLHFVATATNGSHAFIHYIIDGIASDSATGPTNLLEYVGSGGWHELTLDRQITLSPGTHTVGVQGGNDGGTMQVANPYLQLTGYNQLPTLANSGQSLLTTQQPLAGLNVYRKITVPSSGGQDFARTIEYLQNPTSSPITTTVTLSGTLGAGVATKVFATSSGDTTTSVNDEWFGTDGGPGTTAVITIVHGPQGLKPTSVTVSGANVQWTYNITVPAGGTVELGTFTIQASSEPNAITEANALVMPSGFGGNAAEFLSSSDLAALANFQFVPVTIGTTSLAPWTVNTPGYNQTISASGGTGTLTFSSSGTLPPGLVLSSTGVLSGSPTTAGSYAFTVTATDIYGDTGSQAYTVTINPAVSIATTLLPKWTVNGPTYTQVIGATGGTGSLTFSSSGTLPTGLTLSPGGVLNGTPTATGAYNFAVTATDTLGASANQSYTVAINPPVTITAPGLGITSGLAEWLRADAGVTVSGSGLVSAWADQSGQGNNASQTNASQQAQLVANAINGNPALSFNGIGDFYNLAGQVLTSQQFTIFAVVSDTGTSSSGYREVFSNWDAATGNAIPSVFLGTASNASPNRSARLTGDLGGGTGVGTITNPASPFVFTGVSGASDASLYQNGTLFASRGFPLSSRNLAGPYVLGQQGTLNGEYWQGNIAEVLVYNRELSTVERQTVESYLEGKYFTIPLPNWTQGAAGYNQTISATGGTGSKAFALATGTLPAGLTLGSSGVLAGTPTAAGGYAFTVTATDAVGASGSRNFAITVNPPVTFPSTSLQNWTVNQPGYNQTITATGGTGTLTYSSSGVLPAGLTLSSSGVLTGTPTAAGSHAQTPAPTANA